MIPAAFDYFRPTTIAEAIQLLDSHRDAKVLSGGHSLIPLMKLRLAEPAALVDIGAIRSLAGITEANGEIAIGGLTTHHTLESSELLSSKAQVVSEAAAQIGDVQVRNRGTVGGSLVHADPGADLPAVMLAMDATIVLRGPGGERSVSAQEFFVEMLTTAIEPNEILTEVRVSALPAGSGSAYVKFPNPASGYSVAGSAVVLRLDGSGTCQDVRIGISGVGAMAVRASKAEAALRGQPVTAGTIQAAAALASEGIDALEDIHASGEYRLHLGTVMTRRALEAAAARARA